MKISFILLCLLFIWFQLPVMVDLVPSQVPAPGVLIVTNQGLGGGGEGKGRRKEATFVGNCAGLLKNKAAVLICLCLACLYFLF